MKVYASVIFVAIFSGGIAIAERYENPQYGFSIEIPAGWVEISEADIRDAQVKIDRSGERSTCVVGFKSTPAGSPTDTPYILVQYKPNDARRQFSSEQIRSLTDSILRGSVTQGAEAMLGKSGVQAKLTVHKLEPGLDMDRNRFFYAIESRGSNGTVFAGAVLLFGRTAEYQCGYYVPGFGDLIGGGLPMRTLASFELDTNQRWDSALDTRPRVPVRDVRAERPGEATVGLLVLVAAIGYAVWQRVKRRKT